MDTADLPRTRRYAIATLMAIALLFVGTATANAGCSWYDVVCHISESIGQGAGAGLGDSLRPLVTDVMEREAPALIAQLQASIDHNVMTAEQASEKLAEYATSLLNKAANDVLENAQNRTQKLIEFARMQTSELEQQVFADIQKIITDLHCEQLSVNSLMERQQKIFDENVNTYLSDIFFWVDWKSEFDTSCRDELHINQSMKMSELGIPTTFKLWRCVRLKYVDPNGPVTAVLDAYDDVAIEGKGTMCALKTGADAGLRDVTAIWMNDTQAATAWERAIRGH